MLYTRVQQTNKHQNNHKIKSNLTRSLICVTHERLGYTNKQIFTSLDLK